MDAWLLDFVKENMITLSLVLGILKIFAVETDSVAGNKIIELLSGFIPNKKIKK